MWPHTPQCHTVPLPPVLPSLPSLPPPPHLHCGSQINEIVALRGKLPQAVIGKRFGIEQTDVSQIQRQHGKGLRLQQADDRKVRGSCASGPAFLAATAAARGCPLVL